MEFLQLKYFCDAAQTENFSMTARKFLVPTSGISQSIKRLEEELGCALFEHSANKVTLNHYGKQFYEYASQALALLDQGKKSLADTGERLAGDIRVICMSNRGMVTAAIEKFMQLHPDVNFTICHNARSGSDFDILISDVCPFEYSKKVLLLEEGICVAMKKDNPLANKENLSVSDLKGQRFVSMTPGSSIQRIAVAVCEDAGFSPNVTIQSDDPFYVRKYVQMGLGIALVPSFSWRGLFDDTVVLRTAGHMVRKTYAFFPRNKYISRATEAYLEILEKEIRESRKIDK